jgi:5'-3' exonuclease
MGVKDFSKVFKHKRTITLKDYKNKTLAIDAMTELYQASLATKSTHTLTDADGNPTIHLSIILSRVLEMAKYNIKQIWVFDHNNKNNAEFHNPAKNNELLKRKQRREKAVVKLQDIESKLMEVKSKELFSDDEEEPVESKPSNKINIQTEIQEVPFDDDTVESKIVPSEQNVLESRQVALQKQIFTLGPNVINEVKLMFNYLGIHYVDAPESFEGEQIAAYLSATNQCDAVLTADSDPIPFGALVLLRRNTRDKKIYEFTQEEIFEQLKEQGIDHPDIDDIRRICVVLGCDYNDRTPGVGPKTVLKKFQKVELTDAQKRGLVEFAKEPIDDIEVHNYNRVPLSSKDDINDFIEWLSVDKSFNKSRLEKKFDFILTPKEVKTKTVKKTKK